ncbi:DUF6160 family protein [Alkanindiges sp. WGS2144]|uniref:putative pilus system protein FilA n=1 Tax=Alkanindiges sp. WGS2144 TaxID=3366808 RepID=UPI00375114FD
MKLFTKLALVCAIAVSGSAMAMESLDDTALSSATGQEGITVNVFSDGISIGKLLIHDEDGLSTRETTPGGQNLGGTGETGAIVVNDISLAVDEDNANGALRGALANINIDTDGNGGDAFLNIGINTNALAVEVGSIAVAKSADTVTGARRGTVTGVAADDETEILGALSVNIGATSMNIQLGADAPQDALIWANATITNGIKISNIDLKDHSDMDGSITALGGSGSIGIDNLYITTAGSEDLIVNTKIGVSQNGLVVKSSGSQDIYMDAVRLGSASAASIGAVEIQGLNMGESMIVVSGH